MRTHGTITPILEQQAEAKTALPHAEIALTISERIATLDRTNVTWQKDVQISRALVARLRKK